MSDIFYILAFIAGLCALMCVGFVIQVTYIRIRHDKEAAIHFFKEEF